MTNLVTLVKVGSIGPLHFFSFYFQPNQVYLATNPEYQNLASQQILLIFLLS